MIRHVIGCVLTLAALSTTANAQWVYPDTPQPYYRPIPAPPPPQFYYPVPPQQYDEPIIEQPYRSQRSSDLSYKCAQASEYIKHNNCGPQGCDIGLCVALQHGCRINGWGHVCPWGLR